MILTASLALSCIQSSLVFYEVHLGLGNQKIMNDDHKASELVKKVLR